MKRFLKNLLKEVVNKSINDNLMKVLKEFGAVGTVTYVGGFILLTGFIWERDFQRLIMLNVVGILLLSLSISIAYFRLKIQKDREKALIEMTQNIGISLAEQLGKGMDKEQVSAIIQKIRQSQRDLVKAIVQNIGKEETATLGNGETEI
jgi:hypothetical protein